MPAHLTIQLTRVSPTAHRLIFVRPDGSAESVELETKSCLFHDLLHFAVETEAGLANSFYGLLARSQDYAALSTGPAPAGEEIVRTERVVGALTGAQKRDAEPETFLAMMRSALEASDETLPAWLTSDFVVRVKERMRRLVGEWNGTPFGKTMELRFPLS